MIYIPFSHSAEADTGNHQTKKTILEEAAVVLREYVARAAKRLTASRSGLLPERAVDDVTQDAWSRILKELAKDGKERTRPELVRLVRNVVYFAAIEWHRTNTPKGWRMLAAVVPAEHREAAFERPFEDLLVKYATLEEEKGQLPLTTRLGYVFKANLLALDALRVALTDWLLRGSAATSEEDEKQELTLGLGKTKLATDQ